MPKHIGQMHGIQRLNKLLYINKLWTINDVCYWQLIMSRNELGVQVLNSQIANSHIRKAKCCVHHTQFVYC